MDRAVPGRVDPASDGLPDPGRCGSAQDAAVDQHQRDHRQVQRSDVVSTPATSVCTASAWRTTAASFTYDAATFTGKLQLTGNLIGADKLVLHINDTVEGPGRQRPGRRVEQRSIELPIWQQHGGWRLQLPLQHTAGRCEPQRDADLARFDGVLGTDVIKVRNNQFLTTVDSKYSPFDDVNGSGNVSGVDVVAVRNRQFTGLPAGNPGGSRRPVGASLFDDAVDSVFSDNGVASFGKGEVAANANHDSLAPARHRNRPKDSSVGR